MRAIRFIIILLGLCLTNGYCQENFTFLHKKTTKNDLNDTIVFLYIKERYTGKNPVGKYPLYFEGESGRQLSKVYQDILLHEFPNVSDEAYSYLKKISWGFFVFPDGTCRHNNFRVPESVFEHIPDLEKHLANLVVALEKIDFTQYKMIIPNPDKKEELLGSYRIPFSLLRMKVR